MASFNLSDTVIIIICGAGVVLIITVVLFLILCITNKKKDRVQAIRPRRTRQPQVHVPDARPRRLEMPKPPPYSEFPPDYSEGPNYDVMDTEIAENHPATTRNVNATVHRSTSMRTRHGSPHPSASARSRVDRQQNAAQFHDRIKETDMRQAQAETSAHRDTRRNTNNFQVTGSYTRHREQAAHSSHTSNQIRNPAVILNPNSSSYDSSHSERTLVTNPTSELLPGEIRFGESPPPSNIAAAIRREQRRKAIHTLQARRLQIMTPSPPPAYEQYGHV